MGKDTCHADLMTKFQASDPMVEEENQLPNVIL